jgi:pilus assembly protein CpaE
MQIYFFTAGIESSELNELEARIRSRLPNMQKVAKLDEGVARVGQGGSVNHEQNYILFPMLGAESFDRIIDLAEQVNLGVFSIFISREISASDYKRLVRTGRADWVSLQDAPQEILDIISRTSRPIEPGRDQPVRPTIVAFVPSGGGVGNATLAIETAIQMTLNKKARSQRICLFDLDLQGSHLCDYLDIEPRLQMQEIIENPDRLDVQLFELFVSRHATSGIDVLATPRNRKAAVELNMAALDALFRMISVRYDLVLVDLPPIWFDWTDQIISVCDLAVITGFNHVPGLRRIAEIIQQLKNAEPTPPQIVVALNRCESRLGGGIARRQHVKTALGNQTVVYIRDDPAAVNHSLNTGVPISLTTRSNKVAKDVRALASLVSALRPAATSNRISAH